MRQRTERRDRRRSGDGILARRFDRCERGTGIERIVRARQRRRRQFEHTRTAARDRIAVDVPAARVAEEAQPG